VSDAAPKVNVVYVARSTITLGKKQLTPVFSQAIAIYQAAPAAAFQAALDRLETEALAVIFAQRMKEKVGDIEVDVTQQNLENLLAEGKLLEGTCKFWFEGLVKLRLLSEKQASSITQGTGHDQLAGDLLVYPVIFTGLWQEIEQLQKVQKEAAKNKGEKIPEEIILTKKKINRMSSVGTKLEKLLGGTSDSVSESVDWKRNVIVLYSMLERDWHTVRTVGNCHLELKAGPTGSADLIPSLGQMNAEARTQTAQKTKSSQKRDEKRAGGKRPKDEPEPDKTAKDAGDAKPATIPEPDDATDETKNG
jgi:hypothetical protein